MASEAGGWNAALALILTNNLRIVAGQMRITEFQEVAVLPARLNRCAAIIATTVMPHLNFLVLRSYAHSRVSYSDWSDETVTSSRDVDDESIRDLTVTQRATQR